MKYRNLGSSGLKVSEIGLGSWLTYGGGVDADQARACIRRAYELGVILFDTADVYHRGAAEEFLGGELGAYRRSDLVIATKCFFPMSDNPNDRGLSRKHIHESIDASLRRLRADYVDLYQCHRFDPDVPLDEIVRAMDDLVRQGKILYWGTSEWPADQLRWVHETAAAMNAVAPISEQPEYSLAERRVETNGVQQACQDVGMGLLPWSPLKQGVLTGKYSGGRVPKDSRAATPSMNAFLREIDRRLADRVDQMLPIAERHHATVAQLALAWLLHRDGVGCVLVGATRPEQVEENCAASARTLSEDDLAAVERVFEA